MGLNKTKLTASDLKQPSVRLLIKSQIVGCQEDLAGRACAGTGGASFAGDRDSITAENRTHAFKQITEAQPARPLNSGP